MSNIIAYHAVTERPMRQGQHILFDQNHHNGVYRRVMEKQQAVEMIYTHPDRYNGQTLEHHTAVALRELAMEQVRRESFPQYPSRMACLYVAETLEEARQWAAFFANDCMRPTYQVVTLCVRGNIFAGDACNCFDGTPDRARNLALARNYWMNGPNEEGRPIRELLADGDIEVLEIMDEINKNLDG